MTRSLSQQIHAPTPSHSLKAPAACASGPPRPPLQGGGCAHLPRARTSSPRDTWQPPLQLHMRGKPPHRIRHACSNLFCRRTGCSRAFDLASWAMKVCNSDDHLPSTSMAKTTRRTRLPLPTSSGCLLARWSTTPSVSAAPVCCDHRNAMWRARLRPIRLRASVFVRLRPIRLRQWGFYSTWATENLKEICSTQARKSPRGGQAKGPEGVGPPRVGAQLKRLGGPKFRAVFPSPANNFFLSSLSWMSRGILVVFEAPGPEMCTLGVLGLSSRRPRSHRGFTQQPESPNVHISWFRRFGPIGLSRTGLSRIGLSRIGLIRKKHRIGPSRTGLSRASPCYAHTSVVSKANGDPPKMGNPSATTSNLRLSAASGREANPDPGPER